MHLLTARGRDSLHQLLLTIYFRYETLIALSPPSLIDFLFDLSALHAAIARDQTPQTQVCHRTASISTLKFLMRL